MGWPQELVNIAEIFIIQERNVKFLVKCEISILGYVPKNDKKKFLIKKKLIERMITELLIERMKIMTFYLCV